MRLGIALTWMWALAAQAAPAESWDALAEAYEQAFVGWALARGAGDEPAHPSAAFRPRFETLADAGEGRAVLWLLVHDAGAPEERAERAARDLARLARGGDAEWTADGLLVVAGAPGRLDAAALRTYLTEMERETRPAVHRAHALLARAALLELERPADAGPAGELRIRAASLRWTGGEPRAGAPVDLDELAARVLEGVEDAGRLHFGRAYFEGPDGVWYPRAGALPDPEAVWRPVIRELARRGATRAGVWLLSNSSGGDEAEKEVMREQLEALTRAELDDETLKRLARRQLTLVRALGAEFVVPRMHAIAERADAKVRLELLGRLGDALCSAAADEAQRERGLALLARVVEAAPESDAGKRAAGKLFRHENLVVGKPVPDFETVDADGNAFKLSDYRGKVTVLDFWGFW